MGQHSRRVPPLVTKSGLAHEPLKVCFKKWFADKRQSLGISFVARHQNYLQSRADSFRLLSNLITRKSGHLHVGD
jgi:hypothetical protein